MWEQVNTAIQPRAARVTGSLDRRPIRLVALASGTVLAGSYLSVLYHVTDVVGGVAWFVASVSVAVVLASALSRVLPVRVGVVLGALLFVGGIGAYLALIPDAYYSLFTVERVYADTAALLTGQTVLVVLNAGQWAIAIAPGPTFLTWYLTLRRRYAPAALAGGATLGFLTLTGDAGATTTMLGMAGALGLLGFGSIEKNEGTWEQALDLGILLALALFLARTVDLLPDGEGTFGAGEEATPTLEGNLLGTPGQVPIRGSISLSPEVRFTVTADRPSYWRVAAYDRYTGGGWVRTGRPRPYNNQVSAPPGRSTWIYQDYELETDMEVIPGVWKPVFVGPGISGRTLITDMGGLEPTETLPAGESFTVASRRPRWTPEKLREAGTDYPEGVGGRFLQLPESTTERLRRRARELTSDAASPYDAVQVLTAWLQREKEYSLETPDSRFDVADAFVFEMEQGYCVHFATALAVMLRAIGVPARFVVGYTPGERDGEGSFTVRGLHSHAWVEVFFPGTGWVTVDPTPREPREEAERQRLAEGGSARAVEPGFGTAPTPTGTATNTAANASGEDPFEINDTGGADRGTATSGSAPAGGGDATPNPGSNTPTPGAGKGAAARIGEAWGRDRLSVLFGLVGLSLGAYRIGLLTRAYRSIWVRRQEPTDSPEVDVRRAKRRLEYVLSRRFREREPDETLRGYLDAIEAERGSIDERARRVVELYERTRYSGRVTREEAREAIRLVDELVGAE